MFPRSLMVSFQRRADDESLQANGDTEVAAKAYELADTLDALADATESQTEHVGSPW